MKRKVFPLLFLLLFGIAVSAQKIGIKAGGNFSGIMGKDAKGDPLKGYSYKPGFHAGAFGEFDLGQTVSIQLEACYSQKGYVNKSKTTVTIGSMTSTSESNLTFKYGYLDVPLIFNIHFGSYGGYIGLGPQVSMLMSARYDGKVTNTTVSTSPPSSSTLVLPYGEDYKDETAKTDFGLTFGLGAKWESGIEYNMRAGMGLTNVIDQSVSTSDAVMHHLVFSVSIGYAFNAGGGGQKDRYGRSYKKR